MAPSVQARWALVVVHRSTGGVNAVTDEVASWQAGFLEHRKGEPTVEPHTTARLIESYANKGSRSIFAKPTAGGHNKRCVEAEDTLFSHRYARRVAVMVTSAAASAPCPVVTA